MVKSDFLVIGSGIAGLNFTLQASGFGSVCLITKKDLVESNTNFAQGGIAAVLSKIDRFDLHVKDTLKAGNGLSNEKAVRIMVKDAPKEIERLVSFGVDFDRKGEELELSKEGGHSRKRIVYKEDKTGMEVESSLVQKVREDGNVRVFEKHVAFDLIIDNGKCIGARVFDKERKKTKDFFAKVVMLATGGICEVFENTSNPRIATGDGIAIGFRAGCKVKDFEFVQFHPTAFKRKGEPFFVISETVRGEGGILRNSRGRRFVNELGRRDVVARAILKERKGGEVYLDITHKDSKFLKKRFPGIYRTCLEHGIDITKGGVPVEPAAHYACGGLKTDTFGRTNIEGLFAFGEVACTQVHGANRLASNSLLESLIFSSRALIAARKYIKGKGVVTKKTRSLKVISARPYSIRKNLRKLMWRNAGIVRDSKGLESASEKIKKMEAELKGIESEGINPEVIELRNMILVSKLILKAALERKESRGTHHREDYPRKEKKWEKHIILEKRTF
ncbi:MAG: L-aspartate oxidase [Candidatus Aenigmarchaeota archaeon]|nr:L-aspartate oxidase [Candidatus Aenigmarchaeota archaeon]